MTINRSGARAGHSYPRDENRSTHPHVKKEGGRKPISATTKPRGSFHKKRTFSKAPQRDTSKKPIQGKAGIRKQAPFRRDTKRIIKKVESSINIPAPKDDVVRIIALG